VTVVSDDSAALRQAPSKSRLLAAFLLCPLAAPLVLAGLIPVLTLFGSPGSQGRVGTAAAGIWLFAVFATPIAYAISLFAGLPAFLIWRRRRAIGLRECLIGGGVLGVLPFLFYFGFVAVADAGSIFSSFRGFSRTLVKALSWTFLALTSGLACGATFWLIGLSGRREQR
jgi:hypothetical protein